VNAEYPASRELAEQLLALAQKAENPAFVLHGHNSLSNIFWLCGEWELARMHAEHAIEIYDPRQHHSPPFFHSGHDAGVACRAFTALTLWNLGYSAQALQRGHEATALARDLSHAHSSMFALVFQAVVHQRRREAEATRALAEPAVALATQHELPAWLAWGLLLRGWAKVEQGQAEEGMAQLRQAVAGWKAAGLIALQPYFLATLAEAHVRIGQAEEGLATIAEAMAVTAQTHEGFAEAELHRLKGELLVDCAEAEACFHRAIEIARRQRAKSFELRAVTSLSRLYQRQGKQAAARQMLSEIYGWFTEGFDTADLMDAAALLGTLRL
jgi:adenylate cyclase